ncbi:MAG TPA: hypothetical protein VIM92_01685 [Rhodanobacteraceae bacterium]|jgi:hypothetical protein
MDRANLLDMLAVMDEERRYNEAAALVAWRPAQRENYARKARQGAAAVCMIRRELASASGKCSRRRIDACIERLLEAQIDVSRTAAESLDSRTTW